MAFAFSQNFLYPRDQRSSACPISAFICVPCICVDLRETSRLLLHNFSRRFSQNFLYPRDQRYSACPISALICVPCICVDLRETSRSLLHNFSGRFSQVFLADFRRFFPQIFAEFSIFFILSGSALICVPHICVHLHETTRWLLHNFSCRFFSKIFADFGGQALTPTKTFSSCG
jgi:hypothetical protein